ncbi:hypothetical protein HSBAA_61260 [Vreelandella sulfidaeris]|uniref:AsmA domain-containing protein n=1 Tax=Vreelandella sulfidaeris TaxID=115553 RepID=A0A455UF38_9GAMM|nr:hypothetical protein HSBAA_61260 [Halomonas sulfidaeris]
MAPLRSFDGQLNLQADALVLPNDLVLPEFALAAELEDGRLQAEPIQFRLGEGSLTANLALDATQTPASGQLDVDVNDLSLARLGDTFSPIEDRLGRVSGELHLKCAERSQATDAMICCYRSSANLLSNLQSCVSATPAGTDLTLTMETQGTDTASQTFHMRGGRPLRWRTSLL